MRITFTDRLTRKTVTEASVFTLVAKFYDDSTENWTASTPTSVKYRIDNASGSQVRDWTTATPGTSTTITVTAADNAMTDGCRERETKIITVKADDGLSSQYQDTFFWHVANLAGQ